MAGSGSPVFSYLVCTEPRTGSTLLCDGLASTGVAGRPDEYFPSRTPDDDTYWMRRLGIAHETGYVDAVMREAMTPNGVFGVKVHWGQVEPFRGRLAAALTRLRPELQSAPLDRLLREKLGSLRYVWLRRRNKVAQGISYYRATETAVWRQVKGRGDHASHLGSALDFDFEKIDRAVAFLNDCDWRWDDYFRRHRAAPLMLVYEDMIANLQPTVRGVLKYLDLPYEGAVIAAPDIERQADDRSQQWEQRYREMKARQVRQQARSPATPSAQPTAAVAGRLSPNAGPDSTSARAPTRQAGEPPSKDVAAGILNLFESLGYGAFLVDHERRLVARNTLAGDCLRAGLTLRGQRVAASDHLSDMSLQSSITAMLKTSAANGRTVVGVRRRCGQPLLVQIMRLGPVVPQAFNSRWLLLVTYDPIRSIWRAPPIDILAGPLGLTPAEAAVAVGLAAGKSLAEIAEERGVKTETTRAHLKAIFGKTGTRRQVQLAALLTHMTVFVGHSEP